MNIAYAVSGAAISGVVALAVYHELPPLPDAAENVTVAVKADPPASHPVRTIPIIAAPLVAPVITPVITPPVIAEGSPEGRPRTAREPPKSHADVCARHGGHRVDEGRSWHCIFPKRGKS